MSELKDAKLFQALIRRSDEIDPVYAETVLIAGLDEKSVKSRLDNSLNKVRYGEYIASFDPVKEVFYGGSSDTLTEKVKLKGITLTR